MSDHDRTTQTDTVETLHEAAAWLTSERRHADAAWLLRALLIMAPSDERAWIALGECHEAIGDRAGALGFYALGARACSSKTCEVARAKLLAAPR